MRDGWARALDTSAFASGPSKTGDVDGRSRDVFGLTWVAVDETYRDLSGATQDLWHPDFITFARINPNDAADPSNLPDGCAPRWFMSWDPLQNPEPGINIEVKWPEEGEAVKSICPASGSSIRRPPGRLRRQQGRFDEAVRGLAGG